MCTRSRKGTTLIELMIAMVLLAAFLYAATSLAAAALNRSAAQQEVLSVQGAFRSACETIVQDARRASWPNAGASSVVTPAYTGPKGSNPYIVLPVDGSLDSQLAITLPVLDTVTGSYKMHVYRYYLATQASGANCLTRADYLLLNSTGVPDPFHWNSAANTPALSLMSVVPITATLNQLTHAYFVNRGGTVTLVLIANMQVGSVRQVTYCSNLFVRNYLESAP